MKTFRIMGVDPGSRLLGFGCIDARGTELRHVDSGTLRVSKSWDKSEVPLEQRLLNIFEELGKILDLHKPDALAVERVFFAKNAVSALKLGQARGAVLLAGAVRKISIFEYSSTEVKSTVAGFGRAEKDQVARMVTLLTQQKNFETNDASDALAIAICHARSLGSYGQQLSRGAAAPKAKRRTTMAEAIGIDPQTLLRHSRLQR
jgi:crossover junction endodeoxyribonuclease RuvC